MIFPKIKSCSRLEKWNLSKKVADCKGKLKSDSGSLSVFISALFLLTLIFSFEAIDIANSYLAKRHLIQIGEAALQSGAHKIAMDRYFTGDYTVENSSSGAARFRVPLDCVNARAAFEKEIQIERLGNQSIKTTAWSCLNDILTATIRAEIQPPLAVPLLSDLAGTLIPIEAEISASSVIGGGS